MNDSILRNYELGKQLGGFVVETLEQYSNSKDIFDWTEIFYDTCNHGHKHCFERGKHYRNGVTPNYPPFNETSFKEMESHFLKNDKKYFEDLFMKYFEWECSERKWREKPKSIKVFDMTEVYEHRKIVGVGDVRKKYKRNQLDKIIQMGYDAKMGYWDF